MIIESAIVADWHGSEIAVESKVIPRKFNLSPAYPNPFNPITNLKFALPEATDVSIVIYDMQGREVTTLKNGIMDAGHHIVSWNATHHASGIYFVQMNAGTYVKTQKLMLVK